MENDSRDIRLPLDSLDNIDEALGKARARVSDLTRKLSDIVLTQRGSSPAWTTTGLLIGSSSMLTTLVKIQNARIVRP
jgi:hypothetical protein